MNSRALFIMSLALIASSLGSIGCASVDAIKKYRFNRDDDPAASALFQRPIVHEIQKGETLYSLARKYHVSVDDIRANNDNINPTMVSVGSKIRIPRLDARAPEPSAPRQARQARRSRAELLDQSDPVAFDPEPILRRKSIKFLWPTTKDARLVSRFGARDNRKHDGIDLAVNAGAPVLASASGIVIYSGWGPSGYGNIVLIKHSKDYITLYGHNRRNLARKGDRARAGDKIAEVGSTGRSSGPHLHFEIRRARKPVDPIPLLPPR